MRGGSATGVCDEQTPLIKIPPRSVINECLRAASMVNDPRPFNPLFLEESPARLIIRFPSSIPFLSFFRVFYVIKACPQCSPVDAALDLLGQSSRGTFWAARFKVVGHRLRTEKLGKLSEMDYLKELWKVLIKNMGRASMKRYFDPVRSGSQIQFAQMSNFRKKEGSEYTGCR